MSEQKVREFSDAEQKYIQKGLNQTIPKLFADYSTPLPQLLVSPLKNTLLKATVQFVLLALFLKYTKTTFKSVLNMLSVKNALNNPLRTLLIVLFFLSPLLNYVKKLRSNNNILESMKRLPEGATKMDYVSQTAVMSNRLRGGRGSGFTGGFLGGMLGGSMMRRRR